MKILLDTHGVGRKKTGIERYWKNLLTELCKSSLDLHAYIPHVSTNAHKQRFKIPKRIIQHCTRIHNGFYRILFGLPRVIHTIKPSIVHVDYLCPFFVNTPLVLTVHDICFLSHGEYYPVHIRILYKILFMYSIKKATAIICVSHTTKSELEKVLDISEKIVHVIPHGVDAAFHFLKDKNAVRRTLQQKFSLSHNYFLVVGNIEPRKDPFPILTAFIAFHKKHTDYQLVFAGSQKMKLPQCFIDHPAIRYLGYINDNDLNLLYNGATALLIHSHGEGFGLPIIEAMRCRLPVICSNLDVFREIAGKSALFFSSSQSLLKLMEAVITEPSIFKKYSESGYRRSLQFTWSRSAKATIDIYKQICKIGNYEDNDRIYNR